MCKFHSRKLSKDIWLLATTLKVCAVFVTVPFCFCKEYLKLIYIFHVFSIIIHFVGITQMFKIAYIFFEKTEISVVDVVLTSLDLVTNVCIIAACYFTVFRKKQALEELLQNFDKLDQHIDASSSEETSQIYFSLWLYHIIPVFVLIDKFLNNNSSTKSFFENFLTSLYILLLIYVKLLLMLIINVLAKIFVSRYNAFEDELKNVFCSLNVLIGTRKFSQTNRLRKACFLLQKNIEMVDDIFGLTIFAIIVNACGGLLCNFSYTLLIKMSSDMARYLRILHLFAEASVSSTQFFKP